MTQQSIHVKRLSQYIQQVAARKGVEPRDLTPLLQCQLKKISKFERPTREAVLMECQRKLSGVPSIW